MKNLLQILFILISTSAFSQINVKGFYNFNNGVTYRELDLKPDSTFTWFYGMDIYSENRTGIWNINKDTLILYFNSDTLIGKYYNDKKGNFIDTTVYEKRMVKWLITDSVRLNTFYRTVNDTADSAVYFWPSYYNKVLEYNAQGIVIKEYKYCYYKYQKYLCIATTSYENGIKKNILEYHKNLKHGSEMNFYPNGALKSSGKWKKGKRIGKWYYYNDNGVLIKTLKGKKIY